MKKVFKKKTLNGLPIIDAKKGMIVSITPIDVRAGAKKNAQSCAAAQAICRGGQFEEARVHTNRTYVKAGSKWIRFVTPIALRKEIVAFDRGGTFEPGDYSLHAPYPADSTEARAQRAHVASKVQKQKPTVNPRIRHVTTGVRQRFVSDPI